MKTETQEFLRLQDYEGSIEAEETIAQLENSLGSQIDYVFDDMCKELGEETTDDAVEQYLDNHSHIEGVIGWKCLQYDSEEEQFREEDLAWREITNWDR